MQTQKNLVFALVKLILFFISGSPKPPLIQKVSPPPKIEKLFLGLSV